jgi:hypothetical protein
MDHSTRRRAERPPHLQLLLKGHASAEVDRINLQRALALGRLEDSWTLVVLALELALREAEHPDVAVRRCDGEGVAAGCDSDGRRLRLVLRKVEQVGGELHTQHDAGR